MKKKRNFLLKSILLQLNFSLEKAGILLVLVLVFSIQAKAYSQTRITAKRQGVTIDEVLKEVREKSGYRFLYRVEEVNRYGKRDIDVKDEGAVLLNSPFCLLCTKKSQSYTPHYPAGKTTAGLPGECTGGQRKGDR